MRMYDLIMKKRKGEELNTEEINFFVDGFTKGEIPDYQASAMLMAIFFNKMNKRETADLTNAMVESGDKIDLSNIKDSNNNQIFKELLEKIKETFKEDEFCKCKIRFGYMQFLMK